MIIVFLSFSWNFQLPKIIGRFGFWVVLVVLHVLHVLHFFAGFCARLRDICGRFAALCGCFSICEDLRAFAPKIRSKTKTTSNVWWLEGPG